MPNSIKQSDLRNRSNFGDVKSGHHIEMATWTNDAGTNVRGFYKHNKGGNEQASTTEVALASLFELELPGQVPEATRLVEKHGKVSGVFVQLINGFTELKKVRDTDSLRDIITNTQKINARKLAREADVVGWDKLNKKQQNILEKQSILMCVNEMLKHNEIDEINLHWPNANIIERTAIIKALIKKIPYADAVKEVNRELARCLAATYLYEDDDLHLNNIAVDENGTVIRIDFDMGMYHDVTSKMEGGMRPYPRLSEDRFRITANDLRNFPDIQDANIHYWPTKRRVMTGGIPLFSGKGYSATDVEAFIALKNDPDFKKEFYKCLVIMCTRNEAEYQEKLDAAVGEEDQALADCLVRASLARQRYLRSVILELRNDDDFSDEDRNQLKRTIGEDVYAQLKDGDSALHIALRTGDYRCDESLVHFSKEINTTNNAGESPLMVATEFGRYNAVEELLNNGASFTRTEGHIPDSLRQAIIRGHYDIAKLLLDHGAINFWCFSAAVVSLINQAIDVEQYDVALTLSTYKFGPNVDLALFADHPSTQAFFRAFVDGADDELINRCIESDQYHTLYELAKIDKLNDNAEPEVNLVRALQGNYPEVQGEIVEVNVAEAIEKEKFAAILKHSDEQLAAKQIQFNFENDDANKTKAKAALSYVAEKHPQKADALIALRRSIPKESCYELLNDALTKIYKNDEKLTLKEQKKAVLSCLKTYLPDVKEVDQLNHIHKRLDSDEFKFLRELTSRFAVIRWYRGSHGLTETYKSVIGLLKVHTRTVIDEKTKQGQNKKQLKKDLREIRKDKNTRGLFFKHYCEGDVKPAPAADMNANIDDAAPLRHDIENQRPVVDPAIF